jgi:hypothetical protein
MRWILGCEGLEVRESDRGERGRKRESERDLTLPVVGLLMIMRRGDGDHTIDGYMAYLYVKLSSEKVGGIDFSVVDIPLCQ